MENNLPIREWKSTKLGEIVFFSQGIQVPFEKQYLIKFNDSVRFIRIVDITNPNEPLRYIENPGERYLISKTDLAMVRYGTPGLPIMGKEGAIANNLFRIIPKDEISIINRYLYYYFLQPQIQNYLLTVQPSSTMPSITFSVMKDLKINLPPLEEQGKIAGVLGSLDDKIELLREENKTLEAMAQAIFKSWFVDFDIVKAKATGTAKEEILSTYKITEDIYNLFSDSFTDSSLGPIPTGWEVKKLGDFFPIKTGKKDANIAVENGVYPFFTCAQETSKTNEFSFDAEAILLAGNGDFNIKWYRGKFEAYQRTYVLIPTNPKYLDFLYWAMKHFLIDITAGYKGSVIRFITKGMIEDYKILLCPNNMEDFIFKTFSKINNKIEENNKQIQTLTETRDALLPQLISGKIRL